MNAEIVNDPKYIIALSTHDPNLGAELTIELVNKFLDKKSPLKKIESVHLASPPWKQES